MDSLGPDSSSLFGKMSAVPHSSIGFGELSKITTIQVPFTIGQRNGREVPRSHNSSKIIVKKRLVNLPETFQRGEILKIRKDNGSLRSLSRLFLLITTNNPFRPSFKSSSIHLSVFDKEILCNLWSLSPATRMEFYTGCANFTTITESTSIFESTTTQSPTASSKLAPTRLGGELFRKKKKERKKVV
jgi:hypothetical protein